MKTPKMKTRRYSIEDKNETEASDAGKKTEKSDESSIFSTILADIEENPTILQSRKLLIAEVSTFSTILADVDEEEPTTILQKKKNNNNKLKKIRRKESMETPIDFTSTVSQALTRSGFVEILNQELKILESEMEMIKRQASDRECDCVEEKKVEQREEVKFLADEVIEWLLRDETESEVSRFPTEVEDSVCSRVEDGNSSETLDEMLSTMLGDEDEQVNNTEGCVPVDDIIEEILEENEKDGSYLYQMRDGYAFGGFLDNVIRDRLIEKAEEEEKEISSWISNGEPQDEAEVAEEEKEVRNDIKEEKKKDMTPNMVVKTESTVTKRDCNGYRRRLCLIEKLRERHENLVKKRVKAARLGVELSFLVAEFMFLIPNEILACGTQGYSMPTKPFAVNEDDKGTSVVIGKLQEVSEIVIWKMENKSYNADLPESILRYDDFIFLCSDAIRDLGKIVWDLKKNNCERLKLSESNSLFEDCQKTLVKIELKLAEMKQWVYRSVSTDYESFSKSERFDRFLRRKLMKRIHADNRFQRSVIGSYFVEIWKSVFRAETLQ